MHSTPTSTLDSRHSSRELGELASTRTSVEESRLRPRRTGAAVHNASIGEDYCRDRGLRGYIRERTDTTCASSLPEHLGMSSDGFNTTRSRVSAELKMLIINIAEMGLDPDTAEFVSDRAARLISELEYAEEEKKLERIESGLSRLQLVIHQARNRETEAP
jgi:hypothetical protein